MMALKLACFVNLLLAALLAGNEFRRLVAVHPALVGKNSRCADSCGVRRDGAA